MLSFRRDSFVTLSYFTRSSWYFRNFLRENSKRKTWWFILRHRIFF